MNYKRMEISNITHSKHLYTYFIYKPSQDAQVA